jgi:hypothetical protein
VRCAHVFVTSQGSAYSQFKRALAGQNFLLAWTLAAELPKVPLADALSLLLLALGEQRGGRDGGAALARPALRRGAAGAP